MVQTSDSEETAFRLEFRRTSDWWIDFGLVCLHDAIRGKEDILCEHGILFEPLSKSSPNSYALVGDQAKIRDFLVYMKDTISAEEYFIYKSGNKGVYIDTETKEPIVYEKQAPLLHLKKFFGGIAPSPKSKIAWNSLPVDTKTKLRSLCKDAGIPASQQDDSSDAIFVGQPQYKISWEPELETGKKTCFFSGQKFSKLIEAKGYYYPALVDPSKMQTFYSGHSGKVQMGSPYALAALFAPLKLKYVCLSRKGTDATYLYFAPVAQTLYELRLAQDTWVPLDLEKDHEQIKATNFEKSGIYGELPAENMLPYIIAVYSRANMRKLASEPPTESQSLIKSTLDNHGITVMAFTDSGMWELRGFDDYFEVLKLMNLKEVSLDDFKKFIGSAVVRAEKKRDVLSTQRRNEISRAFLSSNSIGYDLENLLFETVGNVIFSWKVYEAYTEAIGKMTEEELDVCSRIGTTIGNAAANRKSIGCIYDFRNARTRAQFLEALEKFQFVLGSHKDDSKCFEVDSLREFVKQFNTSLEWKEMKSAVVIRAVNGYQSTLYAKSKRNETGDN